MPGDRHLGVPICLVVSQPYVMVAGAPFGFDLMRSVLVDPYGSVGAAYTGPDLSGDGAMHAFGQVVPK